MRLLLHTCCADCLIRYLEILGLKPQDELLINNSPHPDQDISNPFQFKLSDLTIYYSNSNIYPKSEYDHRLDSLRKITNLYNLPLVIADYQPQDFFQNNPLKLTKAPPSDNQNFTFKQIPTRCLSCWSLRLSETFNYAHQTNLQLKETSANNLQPQPFTHFSTTLLVSQYQNTQLINQTSANIIKNSTSTNPTSINFFSPHTAPAQFYKTGGFYKQNYCGCLYSLIEKTAQKY